MIDQATAPKLTALAGVADAVAIFRVGFTDRPPVPSRRRAVDVLMAAPRAPAGASPE